ncbi:hypothetical protein [Nocardioides plantarum]|uniref:Uncharacterized protein n=1 Tax=Nocardioides plantarum TaxID=29299 RepID=A0ABV5K6H4_9ACTN|nr:hypothetical protein [Nocardioides plantarum]
MVDRILMTIAIVTHTYLAAAFVLTDGPAGNPVILKLSTEHGVHESDVPALLVWAIGVAAVVALWIRARGKSES